MTKHWITADTNETAMRRLYVDGVSAFYEIKSNERRRACWFLVSVPFSDFEAFEKHYEEVTEDNPLNLEQWGEVLFSGWGKPPTAPLQKIQTKVKVQFPSTAEQ